MRKILILAAVIAATVVCPVYASGPPAWDSGDGDGYNGLRRLHDDFNNHPKWRIGASRALPQAPVKNSSPRTRGKVGAEQAAKRK